MKLRHIAFIMDGNGRWAVAHGLPREDGYKYGLAALMRVLNRAIELNVECMSVYAYSTENRARPEAESSAIFQAVEKFNRSYDGKARVLYMGDIDALDDSVAESIELIEQRTALNKGTTLNIALNYGAQADIVHAAKIASDNGDFTKSGFLAALGSAGLPPLDMIVRTGGQKRLSNFMLFEAAYAELMFTDKLWCDMDAGDLDAAIAEFESRTRTFGK